MQIKPPTASVESVNSLESSTTVVASDDLPHLTLSGPCDGQVLVSVVPPSKPSKSGSAIDIRKRAPLDICCVIDVSGSMGTEASIPADPTTGAPAESTGLSVLDVVKHALRTIISTMQEDDRIALVAFSDKATVVAGLTAMTKDGRSKVLDAITSLRPLDCTNLWDGLKVGMDLLSKGGKPAQSKSPVSGGFSRFKSGRRFQAKEEANVPFSSSKDTVSSSGRLSTLFILTDGMPNIAPPRGHVPMLKSYLDSMDNSRSFSISTFGFGYSLDSPLLLEIAQVGGGGYSFIPDSGIVGTVFVHAVANAYAAYAPQVKLDIEIPDGAGVEVKGGLSATKTSWGIQIAAGDVQFGQSLDIVLKFKEVPKEITASLTYRPPSSNEDRKVQAMLSNTAAADLAAIRYHAARLEFVEILWSVNQSNLPSSIKALEEVATNITTSPMLANHSDALALAKDISGEGILALQPTNFSRWGRHYLPSLARSHQRQQCGNFKDPGLQVYGRDSVLFIEERDKLDAAFMALPPPKPSITRTTSHGTQVPYAPLKSMSKYYSASGPCFAGDCLVSLSGGGYMRVEDLKRGIEVQTLTGTNKVAAVVRTAIPSGEGHFCRIGDLKITPWHPIISPVHNGWVFPTDVVSPERMACEAVYSVLLLPAADKGDPDAHSMSIGGVWCVTLGHGLTSPGSGDVRSHNFLGNYEILLKELSSMAGFYGDYGVVKCIGTKRDSVHGMICGFVEESQSNEKDGHVDSVSRSTLCV